MEIEIIHEPYMFLETLEMLYKYVNGIRFADMLIQRSDPSEFPLDREIQRRLDTLQTILNEVCQDLDPLDPQLQKFFALVEREPDSENTCLARLLVSPFVTYQSPDFDGTVTDILTQWDYMNQVGGQICLAKGVGLRYVCQPGKPRDLFSQIYALDLAAEVRLALYGMMHRFTESIQELADLMRPIAARLEKAIRQADLPMEKMAEYWNNARVTPLEFLSNTLGKEAVEGAGDRLRLAVGLMSANTIFYAMQYADGKELKYNYMFIGCCISYRSMQLHQSLAWEDAGATLRGLSERKRLEVLHRLAKKRQYGQELAEDLEMDRGNLSRLLTVLCNQGFLIQERENQRIYYRADKEAVQRFFDHLVSLIFD